MTTTTKKTRKKMTRAVAVREFEAITESGYMGRDPVRVSVYLFPSQIELLEHIAKVRGVTKRHLVFEMAQSYIGTWSELLRKDDRP